MDSDVGTRRECGELNDDDDDDNDDSSSDADVVDDGGDNSSIGELCGCRGGTATNDAAGTCTSHTTSLRHSS